MKTKRFRIRYQHNISGFVKCDVLNGQTVKGVLRKWRQNHLGDDITLLSIEEVKLQKREEKRNRGRN